MERHGSESFFVVDEGLLTESLGGRTPTLAARVEREAPPVSLLTHGAQRKRASG